MRWFNNLKIYSKLTLGFMIIAVIAGIVGVVGIFNINKINSLDTEIYMDHTKTMPNLTYLINAYQLERVVMRDVIVKKDTKTIEDNIDKIKDNDKIIDDNMEIFRKANKNDEVSEILDDIKVNNDKFRLLRDNVISLVQSNKSEEAMKALYGSNGNMSENIQKDIDNLLKLKTNLAKQSSEINDATAQRSLLIMIGMIIFAVVLALLLGTYIARIVSKPIKEIVKAVEKIAAGDLNVSIDLDTKDELGVLATTFNKMADTLKGVMQNISISAEEVASSSKQVSDSSIYLAEGAGEQASSIEELTATIEEISAQVTQNAENGTIANNLSMQAKENAVKGNHSMESMVNAMNEISYTSSSISNIIKVIDEIAFQTNILALNAAVEAARAGQHGRGFAVVAEEVRNLAGRSGNAAKETTAMIEDSIKKVELGMNIAKDTAVAFNEIVSGITKTAEIVNDISAASKEQALGIEQITQGITEVSQVVQINSATAEESASASEDLTNQAELLKEQINKFKFNN